MGKALINLLIRTRFDRRIIFGIFMILGDRTKTVHILKNSAK